ncbi:uncharacterized protein BO72DRAFT_429038 [Aspergillus fijiensis CBS 313.89]|uniref:Uncharacterized protein n=1 Tax=Aspergillus fijiensis CBS 313.89 TaxID=1448319 RepID=A0A8G1VY29_9EURO|nr:uncharacterized protein BO72DRAFT_429038 [Aspergillus fijiensis CBS 313.89]RAK77310.1 hypothetical protein BO72DRAFT_429038 [Aspergillus fijiensis CBS 313.89]
MFKQITSISRSALRQSSSIHHLRQTPAAAATATVNQKTQRPFHSIPALRTSQGQREEMESGDRNVLDPQPSEFSKTGTDQEVSQHDAAFDPSKTSPESQIEATQEETNQSGKVSNPLNVSGANKGVSEGRDPTEGAPERNADREASSKRGQTKKGKEVNDWNKKY